MAHQEKYNLTWHSHADHWRDTLKELMTSEEFADVTLVTDDKKQFQAHRNILSACSPVFKNILQQNSNNTNPVIYLRGIQHSEMESIMQFIYLGEARFNEERISEFLQVSKNLEIKNLSADIEIDDQSNSNEERNENEINAADENVIEDFKQQTENEDANVEIERHTITRSISRNNLALKKVSTTDGVKYACSQCDKQ